MRIFLLALMLLCAACARHAPPAQADCPALYTILPDNFIIDVAAGSQVMLNPAADKFPLFCSPAEAKKALAKGDLPKNWRVYSLEGSFADIGGIADNGQYMLAAPALVKDWVE